MTELLQQFHFIRPWYGLGLIPIVFLVWGVRKHQDARRPFKDIIADHLLAHLLVGEKQQQKIRPWHLLAALWAFTILALSGPTWQQEPSPFVEDKAALFMVLKVAPSMEAEDIQPSRLKRAVQKIHDLLGLRAGASNGLIAYSGSAHLVMPLTKDRYIIDMFAAELSPEIMPEEGDALAAAVQLAEKRLEKSKMTGSILVITDSAAADQLNRLESRKSKIHFPVHFLAMSANRSSANSPGSAMDVKALEKTAKALGGRVSMVTADEQDVESLARQMERHLMASASTREGAHWRDSGYWLVPLICLISLMWAVRGWVVRYE